MLVVVRWHGYLCTFLRSIEILFRMCKGKYKDSFIKMQMKKQTLGQGAHKHQYFYAVDDYLKDLAFILKVTLLYTWQQLQMIENVLVHFILFIHIINFIYFVSYIPNAL